MKLKGQTLTDPPTLTLVLPRESGPDLVFKACAVMSYDEFDALCPTPQAPEKLVPGGETVKLIKDPDYLKALDVWSERRTAWTFLKSLEATDGLEWETIKMDDPDSWMNYQEEITTSGIAPSEQNRILQIVLSANALDQEKIDEATKRFLAEVEEKDQE